MILPPPAKEDFSFQKDIQVDSQNKGFSPAEIEKLAEFGPGEAAKGEMGVGSWWKEVWGLGRSVSPEIQNLKSDFGYQKNPILTDLIQVAEHQGTPLDGLIKAKKLRYNFFIMQCGVYIFPEHGEKFEALKFEVRYKDDNVSTYSMLPGPQADKILAVGGKADIGVTGKVDFGFPAIPLHGASVEGAAKVELEAKFIVAFEYELKTQVVDSFGIGNPFCKWSMYKGDKLRNDVVFYPVIMTPKAVTGFECEFKAYFKISHPHWKNSEFFLKPPKTIAVSV